jgi:dGTPase
MWHQLLSKKRYTRADRITTDQNETPYRTSFHRDYDRLIFSNAFRRLSRKTQVHPLSKNDHVHNRLTHSLEVASVGRSMGLRAGAMLNARFGLDINPHDVAYIVQTACLAHDIGNPPFGHAGEEIIQEWFGRNREADFLAALQPRQLEDFLHLDGNAQSFRIVTQLENNFLQGGLRLTFATLGTLVKYPHPASYCRVLQKSKFNFFLSEQAIFDLIFSELGLKHQERYLRHPLSYLMEAADDICYGLLDIQDAFELKVITLAEVQQVFAGICGDERVDRAFQGSVYSEKRVVSSLVADAINQLTEHAMEIFDQELPLLQSPQQPEDLIGLFGQEQLKQGLRRAKQLARAKIFTETRKVELELTAHNIITAILDNLIPAVYQLYLHRDINQLSFKHRRALTLMDEDQPLDDAELYSMYQRVIDYLVGMTDNYAQYVAHRLTGLDD